MSLISLPPRPQYFFLRDAVGFSITITEGYIGTDALNIIENYRNFLKRAIACHKSWFFTYDPETYAMEKPNFTDS